MVVPSTVNIAMVVILYNLTTPVKRRPSPDLPAWELGRQHVHLLDRRRLGEQVRLVGRSGTKRA